MFEQVQLRITAIVFVIMLVLLSAFTVFNVYRGQERAEEVLLRKGRVMAHTGASFSSRFIETAIDSGQLTKEEAFDTDYEEIPGTSPAQYLTSYTEHLDQELRPVLDSFQEDEEVVFAVLTDRNGYLPTHNTNFLHRARRIFDDEVGLSAARNEEGLLQQVYRRDTGEIMWDISYPVYVHGEHWGGFRLGFSMEKIQEMKLDIALETIIGMGIITLIIGVSVYVVTKRATSPLA